MSTNLPGYSAPLQRPWRSHFGIALISILIASRGDAVSLVNHDFSSGLNGWSTIATVFDTGQSAVLSDQGGKRVVIFQSAAVPAGSPGLSLSFDFFNALSNVVPLGGTPDSVFFSTFLGQTAFGSSFDQGIFDLALGLLDADYRGPANLAPGTVSSPSPKGAGWTHFIVPLAPAPVITVGFEFIEGNGTDGDSAAAVDNVLIEVVPEPTTGGSLLVALATWLLQRRRASIFLRSHR